MRNLILTVFMFGLLGTAASAAIAKGQIRSKEVAIECEKFQLATRNGNGFVVARECKKCQEQRLNITNNTKAFYKHSPVPLSSVPASKTGSITVFYDEKTRNVNRISW